MFPVTVTAPVARRRMGSAHHRLRLVISWCGPRPTAERRRLAIVTRAGFTALEDQYRYVVEDAFVGDERHAEAQDR